MTPDRLSAILLGALAACALGAYAECPPPPAESPVPSYRSVSLEIDTATGTHRLSVEVAETLAQRARGLMYRAHLKPMAGMLFDYGRPGRIMMWMQNTCIPLDMLFYGPEGRITQILEHTEPFSTEVLSSHGAARGVIELNAGTARALDVAVGDRVRHPLLVSSP